MRAVIYTSLATVSFDTPMLDELARASAHNNRQRDLTGFLAYFDGSFVQYLEGSDPTLQRLIDVIGHDDRHADVREQPLGELTRRRFPDWAMRDLSSQNAVHAEHLLRQLLSFRNPATFTLEERRRMIGRSLDLIARFHGAASAPP